MPSPSEVFRHSKVPTIDANHVGAESDQRQSPPVLVMLDVLAKCNQETNGLLDELTGRLEIALTPDPPQPVSAEKAAPDAHGAVSPLCSRLIRAAQEQDSINRRISKLLHRLDLIR